MLKRLLPLLLLASALRADEPMDVLALKGKEHAVERLVAIQRMARPGDPLSARALAAAYARLEADPQSGFSPEEKVAMLQAMGSAREGAAGPCACRALSDASRDVRRAALQALWDLRHPQAVPDLVSFLEAAGRNSLPSAPREDRVLGQEDLAMCRKASALLEILANGSQHFDPLSGDAERQIAVTRWRKWWEDNRAQARADWQKKGFAEAGVQVQLPLDAGGVPALVEALSEAKPAWVRENALELLSSLPPPAPAAKVDQPACAALAKGLASSDAAVQRGSASALFRVLAAGGHGALPDPSGKGLVDGMRDWWAKHGGG